MIRRKKWLKEKTIFLSVFFICLVCVMCLALNLQTAREDDAIGKERDEIRLFIRSDIPCLNGTADIYGEMDLSIKRFEEKFGIPIVLDAYPTSNYEDALYTALHDEHAPHLIWVQAAALRPLAEMKLVMPLAKQKTLPDEKEPITHRDDAGNKQSAQDELFVYNGYRYGVPIGDEGELAYNAYMMTSRAVRENKQEACLTLMEHLAAELPPPNRPDIVVKHISVKRREHRSCWDRLFRRRSRSWLEVKARIANLGEQKSVKRTAVAFELGRQRRYRRIQKLDVGEEQLVRCRLRLRDDERHQLKVTVDPFDRVVEDNEVNNIEAVITDINHWPLPPTPPTFIGTPFEIHHQAAPCSTPHNGPKVAFDGQNYMVVYEVKDPMTTAYYSSELRAMRIAPDGQILDPGGFPITPFNQGYRGFELAFDGSHTFLVVWSRFLYYDDNNANPLSIIEGVKFGVDGSLYSPGVVTIEDAPPPAGPNRVAHEYADVFFYGTYFWITYQSCVQWTNNLIAIQEAQSGIYMRRLLPTPNTEPYPTRETLVTFDSNVLGWLPQVAFSEAQSRGLIVFVGQDGPSGPQNTNAIYCYWFHIQPNYAVVLSPRKTATTSTEWRPFNNPTTGSAGSHFLVAWEDVTQKLTTRFPDLYSAFGIIQPNSVLTGTPPAPLVQCSFDSQPRIAHNGQNFTVAFRHHMGCHSYAAAISVANDNTHGNIAAFDFGGAPNLVNNVDIAYGDTNGLIVFESQHVAPNGDLSHGIWGLFISK